jgi:manganese efflux pump family protein
VALASFGFIHAAVLAVGLAMDAFAASLGKGAGAGRVGLRDATLVGLCFGGFQFAMPLAGWWLGVTLAGFISAIDHWIAFGLLLFIGINMIRPDKGDGAKGRGNGLGLATLLILGVATSIDAAAAGIGLGFLEQPILMTAALIGVVTFVLSFVGMMVGRAAGAVLGRKAEILGGFLLIGLGTKILIEHTL